VNAVQSYLDIREINGYSIQYTDFHPLAKTSVAVLKCMVYIGLPSNPQFLGKQSPQDVADVIARSTGPSGNNSEYLFMLEEALEDLASESGDEHVKDLANRVRKSVGEGKQSAEAENYGNELAGEAVEREIERVRGGEGGQPVEEAEKAMVS